VYITVNNAPVFVYTAGKTYDAHKPSVVFIHGVLNDHSVWILQSRYFANHGYNVLAIDLPGHGKSGGEAPQTVEQGAQTVIALLDAVGVQQAALVGHSFGSLIALEAAAQAPSRVSQLALLGAAFPMRVSAALLDAAVQTPLLGIDMVTRLSLSMMAPPPSTLGPGTWLYGTSRALQRRIWAGNTETNVFYRGFKACDNYQNGEQAMEQVQCPTLFLLGQQDQMTPPKAAQSLVKRARHGQVQMVASGHALMEEAPDAVLDALWGFLRSTATASAPAHA